MPENVVLLHGFSGTHRAWDGVVERLDQERYLPLALDLPGHGVEADCARPITFEGCVSYVLARSPERFVLCGYSLGGRIALHVALAAPERVSRLVLVSSTAGIDDASERTERCEADHKLARELESGSFEDFIRRWRTQPMFASEPSQVSRLAREDQHRNSPEALAEVLRGLGTGAMQPLWGRLRELTMRTTVIVGDRDAKYIGLGRGIVACAGGELRVVAGGHGLPLENPAAIASALDEPLSEDMLERRA